MEGHSIIEALQNIASLLVYDKESPMLFSSGLFWLLFLLFMPIYALLKGNRTRMIVFVCFFSLYFYYKSSGFFVVMLLATSFVDWLVSRWMMRYEKRGERLALMWTSIVLSVLIIFFSASARSIASLIAMESSSSLCPKSVSANGAFLGDQPRIVISLSVRDHAKNKIKAHANTDQSPM